jgi:riboflavin biosynthesis pyrimidine reductase
VHKPGTAEAPFVYGNFVSSLDGRIALVDASSGVSYLPEGLTNPNDFRLFLELQAQADCLITRGGYMRAIAAGRPDDILQVRTGKENRDLAAWRRAQGLSGQPAVVIASANLDFPMPESVNCTASGYISPPGRKPTQTGCSISGGRVTASSLPGTARWSKAHP